jgi:predicted transcriptional regulator
MKIGYRKPNIKKRLKAQTTGKANRTIKKTINPLYSKKGMGLIKNPKKAVYNKVYNKTTTSGCLIPFLLFGSFFAILSAII